MEQSTPCKVVLASTIAQDFFGEVLHGLTQLQVPPLLVGFLANEDPAGQRYADWTMRTCNEK